MKKLSPDRLLNYFDDLEPKFRIRLNWLGLAGIILIFWLIHLGQHKYHLSAPDPINIFNHIGNVDSVIPALTASILFGWLLTKITRLSQQKLKLLTVGFGTFVGLIVNTSIETQFGMNLLDQPNISDPLDVIWGTLFCLTACLVSLKFKEARDQS